MPMSAACSDVMRGKLRKTSCPDLGTTWGTGEVVVLVVMRGSWTPLSGSRRLLLG